MNDNLSNLIICVCCVIFSVMAWLYIGEKRSQREAKKQQIEEYFQYLNQYDTTTVYNRIRIYDKIKDLRAEMEEND